MTEPEGVQSSNGGRRRKRFLSPSQKYEIWLGLLRGEYTMIEAADRAGVDRSTIMKLRAVAKQGALDALAASRPGRHSYSGRRQIGAERLRQHPVASGPDPPDTSGFADDAVAALLGRKPSGGRGRAICSLDRRGKRTGARNRGRQQARGHQSGSARRRRNVCYS